MEYKGRPSDKSAKLRKKKKKKITVKMVQDELKKKGLLKDNTKGLQDQGRVETQGLLFLRRSI